HLSEHIGSLCLSSEYSDVTLIVEGQRIPAHKVILAASSDYFRALLYGGMREANQAEVELQAPLQAFKALLRYVYSGHTGLSMLREDTVLDMLGLAHLFNFQELEAAISDYLRQTKMRLRFCSMIPFCNCQFWFNANQLWVKSEAGQAQVAVCSWFNANQLWVKSEAGQAQVRGARVISGDMRAALLDGDTETYDMERGYTRHTITDAPDNPGILVRLPATTIINHLRLLLWDRDNRETFCRSWQNLYFEPRVVKYIKIVGTSNTVNKAMHTAKVPPLCRGFVKPLHNVATVELSAVVIEGIRWVVRARRVPCRALEAMHTAKASGGWSERVVPPLCRGFVKPLHNVATVELSAVVIEGISRSRNALLNGDTEHYDWEQGYTCHQLGSGCIVVQLAQPYMLSSIRLLLWDCDYRHYSYYVEVSLNNWEWQTVCDRTRDSCRLPSSLFIRTSHLKAGSRTIPSSIKLFHIPCTWFFTACPLEAPPPDEDGAPPLEPPTPPEPEEPRTRSLPPAETATEAAERYDE
ncbi:BTB/POZ domain-containing protein 9, partial [Operophtera brumata]